MADSDPPEPVLGWHRVCLNTIVRATKELESARLRILPMGSRVNVIEVNGRRVRIDQPIDGWCSIESSNGDLILSPTQTDGMGDGEGVTSPDTNHEQMAMQGRAEQLAKELQELKWLRAEVAQTKNIQSELEKAQMEIKNLRETEGNLSRQLDLLQTNDENNTDKPEEILNRVQMLEQEKKLVEQQVADLQRISDKRLEEVETLKQRMGNMADSYDVPSSATSENTMLQNGDVVLMGSGDIVIVRFCGPVHWDTSGQAYLGVELSDPMGDTNGDVDGQQYFTCPDNCGQFFPQTEVKKKIPAEFLLQKLHLLMKSQERERTAAE